MLVLTTDDKAYVVTPTRVILATNPGLKSASDPHQVHEILESLKDIDPTDLLGLRRVEPPPSGPNDSFVWAPFHLADDDCQAFSSPLLSTETIRVLDHVTLRILLGTPVPFGNGERFGWNLILNESSIVAFRCRNSDFVEIASRLLTEASQWLRDATPSLLERGGAIWKSPQVGEGAYTQHEFVTQCLREVCSRHTGDDKVAYTFDVDSGSIHPCYVEDNIQYPDPSNLFKESPPAAILSWEALQASVSLLGLITRMKTPPPIEPKPCAFFYSQARFAIANVAHVVRLDNDWAASMDSNSDMASIKAFVEGIERVASGTWPSSRVHLVPKRSLRDIAREILGYSLHPHSSGPTDGAPTAEDDSWNEDYPAIPVQKLTVVSSKIRLGEEVLLPLDLVYYPVKRSRDSRFHFANSSGCAGHISYRQAVESALLELSERDSIMLAWLGQLSLPIIRTESLPSALRDRLTAFESSMNVQVSLLHASLDKPCPHIIALCRNRIREYPYFHMSASASTTIDTAIENALNELERPYYFSNDFFKPSPQSSNAQLSTMNLAHSEFYRHPDHFGSIEFLFQGEPIDYADLTCSGRIDELVSAIGGSFYAVDLSNSVSLKYGVRIVRVLSDRLVPIWFGNRGLPLSKPRIRQITEDFSSMRSTGKCERVLYLHPMG